MRTPARDRRPRQHGRAMLDALARLQLGLLGELDGAALESLAALADTNAAKRRTRRWKASCRR